MQAILVIVAALWLGGCQILFAPEEGAQSGADGGSQDGASQDAGDTVSLTFEQDVESYAGTHDTFLKESQPGMNYGGESDFEWDSASEGGATYGLLRFGDVFGSGPAQVPPGATIQDAVVRLTVISGGELPMGSLHEVLVAWDESSATWDDFGIISGVAAEDYAPLSVTSLPVMPGTYDLNVTESLVRWASGDGENRGWLFVPANSNGIRVASSEADDSRPRLRVTFVP